ncbi:MAG: hypothetical protein IBX68_05605 [Dehalococcoidia bacterium]|nr:hypothetical protein [Dehalococcoidia bacterium]
MNALLFERYLRELDLDFNTPDSLTNKIKLCSYLVCCGASVNLDSYRTRDKDLRTGNAGLQLLVGSPHLRALIPYYYMNGENPLSVEGDYAAGKAALKYAGKEFFEVSILTEVDTGNENISYEFDSLIAAVPGRPRGIRSCCYHSMGKACAFCALSTKKIDLGPEDLVKAYGQIEDKHGTAPQVLLTGGNSRGKDRGLSKFIPYVRALRRSFPEARVAIEASPPQDARLIDNLIESGMHTFAANIEFFSAADRTRLLPGKSEIPIADYERVFDRCIAANIETFSVIIAGPESREGTLEGVRYLTSIGVPANLLCVRPFPGSRLENTPRVNPSWFLDLTGDAVMIMDRSNMLAGLSRTAGCGSCGACSMEMNLFRLRNGIGRVHMP